MTLARPVREDALRSLAVKRAEEPVVRVERRHAGYVLGVEPEWVDMHRFRRLVEQGPRPIEAMSARHRRQWLFRQRLWRDHQQP